MDYQDYQLLRDQNRKTRRTVRTLAASMANAFGVVLDRIDRLEINMTAADQRIETALAGIQQDYGTYQAALDAKDAALADALAQLDAKDAEAAQMVRDAISEAEAQAETAKSALADRLEGIDAQLPAPTEPPVIEPDPEPETPVDPDPSDPATPPVDEGNSIGEPSVQP